MGASVRSNSSPSSVNVFMLLCGTLIESFLPKSVIFALCSLLSMSKKRITLLSLSSEFFIAETISVSSSHSKHVMLSGREP